MKSNHLFEKYLAQVSPDIREEVRLNIDISNRIHEIMMRKKMTQKDLAVKMGKRESEISRWLTGGHGFTTSSLAKISIALGEPVITVTYSD